MKFHTGRSTKFTDPLQIVMITLKLHTFH